MILKKLYLSNVTILRLFDSIMVLKVYTKLHNNKNKMRFQIIMIKCSCGEQIRNVRHKYHLISIRNPSSRLPPGSHMLSVGTLAWTHDGLPLIAGVHAYL